MISTNSKEQVFQLLFEKLSHQYPQLDFSILSLKAKQMAEQKPWLSTKALTEELILECLGFISVEEPDWTFVAAKLFAGLLYTEAAANRGYDPGETGYGPFYPLIQHLTEIGIYDSVLLETYTKQEIEELESIIDPKKDELFTYIGLRTLNDRYLAKDYEKRTMELPQERWMIIAMTLMQKEPKEKRLTLVKEAYWALSNLYMTVATPTLANAGKKIRSIIQLLYRYSRRQPARNLRQQHRCGQFIETWRRNRSVSWKNPQPRQRHSRPSRRFIRSYSMDETIEQYRCQRRSARTTQRSDCRLSGRLA